jgi:hypothetical protein
MSAPVPAVLLLNFNRPDLTAGLIECLRPVQPPRVYFAVDGPRANKPGEAEQVQAVQACAALIDWPCEVHTLFRDQNLGCRQAVSQAISWFFSHEEMGIILEDDIRPSSTFFAFAGALLERYKDVPEIMHISAFNYNKRTWGEASYFFSSYSASIWGWATWRRAWQQYNEELSDIEAFFESEYAQGILHYKEVVDYYRSALLQTRNKSINSWDYIWLYSIWRAKGLSIMPNANLAINIGFDERGTHMQHKPATFDLALSPTGELNAITHPEIIKANLEADKDRIRHRFVLSSSLVDRIIKKSRRLLQSI